ncbi:glutaredoxin family protein [Wolffia australiana]
MGCASSKRVERAVVAEVYKPPPASISVFDINTVEEPWLITAREGPPEKEEAPPEKEEAPPRPAEQILQKMESLEQPPQPWSEVSRALQTLKPDLLLPAGARPVSTNPFLLRDRQASRPAPDDPARRWRRDPLDGLPALPPPGGAARVVLYTTSLRGVRRTFEACETARKLVEAHCHGLAELDERDVSLHAEFLKELRELLGEEALVPRLFVMGRYVGGVEKIEEFNEIGRLRLIVRLAAGGSVRGVCSGCGGARFVPCVDCSGSRKVAGLGGVERCGRCNENGLVRCPACGGTEDEEMDGP